MKVNLSVSIFFPACIYCRMHVYMAAYSHIYLYIQPKCTQIVCKTALQCIHTQEAGAH